MNIVVLIKKINYEYFSIKKKLVFQTKALHANIHLHFGGGLPVSKFS